MTLDVIIPCAGSAKFVEETVESLINQTRKADAIYLADNATGHSHYRKCAEKYASKNVHYVRFEERLTMTLNWQRCLKIGSGEVCLMLHDDDTLLLDALEAGMSVLQEQPSASCALLRRVYQDKPGEDLDAKFRRETEKIGRVDALSEPARSFYISTASMNHMSALFFRKGPLGFFPHLRWLPDQGYIFAHAAHGRVALVPHGGAIIKTHEESLTSTFEHNGRSRAEQQAHFRTVIDFFLEEKGLAAKDIPPIAAFAQPYYLKRVLEACFSWPWRRSRMRFGREIAGLAEMKEFVRRELGYGAAWPAAACVVTSVAADFRYFLSDKKLPGV